LALLGPVIPGMTVGVLWAQVDDAAITLDAGEDLSIDQGSRRGRGFKRIIAFIAQDARHRGDDRRGDKTRGITNTDPRSIVKRPQKPIRGPPSA
jgi:hypothetical protein